MEKSFKEFYEGAVGKMAPLTSANPVIYMKSGKLVPKEPTNPRWNSSTQRVLGFVNSNTDLKPHVGLFVAQDDDSEIWKGYQIPDKEVPVARAVPRKDENSPRPPDQYTTFMGRKIQWFFFHEGKVMGAKVLTDIAEGSGKIV